MPADHRAGRDQRPLASVHTGGAPASVASPADGRRGRQGTPSRAARSVTVHRASVAVRRMIRGAARRRLDAGMRVRRPPGWRSGHGRGRAGAGGAGAARCHRDRRHPVPRAPIPITTIHLGTKVCGAGPDIPGPVRDEVMEAVEEEAERLSRLVEDLLAVVRHEGSANRSRRGRSCCSTGSPRVSRARSAPTAGCASTPRCPPTCRRSSPTTGPSRRSWATCS